MPRKKQTGRKAREEPAGNGNADDGDARDEEEDNDETETTGGLQSVELAIDQLLESRTATREKAMQEVKRGLQLHYGYDLVEKWKTTLSEGVMRGLKKGKEIEFKLAAQLLDVVVLTLGASSEDLYAELSPVLSVIIKDTTASSVVRSAAATSFALLTFVGCTDQVSIKENVKLLEEATFGARLEAGLYPAVLRAWGLLLTTMPIRYVESEALAGYGKKLVGLLDLDDFDARLAAGEVLALLFDMLQESKEAEEDNPDEFDLSDYEKYLDIDDLVDKLKELSITSGHHISKKDKAKLKSSFKDILGSIESGSVPTESITVGSTKVEFYSWARLVQLTFVRQALAEGTLVHFENNELLQEIFNYTATAKGQKIQYSKLEKRLFLSANSAAAKEETLAMRRSRQNFGRESKTRLFLREEDD
jgi:hypothetical protein